VPRKDGSRRISQPSGTRLAEQQSNGVTMVLPLAVMLVIASAGGHDSVRPSGTLATEETPVSLVPSGVDTAEIGKRTARLELRVFPGAVSVNEVPRAILVNSGEVTVEFGHPFQLERKTSAGWRWINRRQAWTLPLLFVEPGESSRAQQIGMWRMRSSPSRCSSGRRPCCVRVLLQPGLYRVTKGAKVVIPDGRGRTLVVRATFRVNGKQAG
jgi:hypothetical protein